MKSKIIIFLQVLGYLIFIIISATMGFYLGDTLRDIQNYNNKMYKVTLVHKGEAIAYHRCTALPNCMDAIAPVFVTSPANLEIVVERECKSPKGETTTKFVIPSGGK